MLRVAVIGSGPAGLYAAEALVKQAAALPEPAGPVRVRVDVYDRLPTPYGLVRYGVAPDHTSIKSIAGYLRRVLESPDVRFVGGVHLGEDVSREELLAAYDAVVYATGAMRDRRLGIGGEDLPGSHAATDFVNWYCGHPDIDPAAFTLDAESVAVIGVGNVAVDVARILARDPAELHATDVPQPVLEALMASKVREIHMIGRRGPAHAKFTPRSCASSASCRAPRSWCGRTRSTWAPSTRPVRGLPLRNPTGGCGGTSSRSGSGCGSQAAPPPRGAGWRSGSG